MPGIPWCAWRSCRLVSFAKYVESSRRSPFDPLCTDSCTGSTLNRNQRTHAQLQHGFEDLARREASGTRHQAPGAKRRVPAFSSLPPNQPASVPGLEACIAGSCEGVEVSRSPPWTRNPQDGLIGQRLSEGEIDAGSLVLRAESSTSGRMLATCTRGGGPVYSAPQTA